MDEAMRPIDRVIETLRENPLDFAGDILELRARFEALGRRPDPEQDAFIEREVGGVPVVELPVRAERGTILFAHAGGYVAGSAMGSFALASTLAGETGRPTFSALLPEGSEALRRIGSFLDCW